MSFITLAESKVATKGSIVVTVTNIGELKAGSSAARDWTRKDITVQDGSGSETMSVWGDDIKRFALNHKYELVGIYWKENKGKWYLNFGQYSTLRDCGVSIEDKNQSTMDSSTTPEQAPSSEDYLKKKQEEIKKKEEQTNKESPLTESHVAFILDKAVTMYFIRKNIENKISDFEESPNMGMIWQMTEKIYDEFKEKYLK